ncbi:hypothetical protein [Crocosphaera sp. Alani8]|uniref:hypothetical protein n=1 Tax=Crocosphaera sp. Alani8 TaxID=3038952 RepID=UPI00313EB214
MLVAKNNLPPSIIEPGSVLSNQTNETKSTLVAQLSPSIPLTNTTIEIQNVGHIATIPYSNNIVSLIINSISYQLTNNPNPDVGSYYIDDENNQILINTGYDAEGLTAVTTQFNISSRLNRVNPPALFRKYPVVENFSFSQTFEGHPSGSFSVRCHRIQYNIIRNAFKPGTPLNLQGIDYRVRRLDRARNLDSLGHELVNISLQRYWERLGNTVRSPLDEPLRESELINENNCGFEYSYRTALSRVGVSLIGGNVVKKVGRDISSSQTITPRQLLEDRQRLLTAGYYVDWSSRIGVILRRWESPRIFQVDHLVADLSQGQKFPSITIAENGFGAEVNGCYLSHELSRAELKLDQDPNGGQDGDEYVCLVQGDRNPAEPPQELRGGVYYGFNLDKLRSPMLCFDNGAGVGTQKAIS